MRLSFIQYYLIFFVLTFNHCQLHTTDADQLNAIMLSDEVAQERAGMIRSEVSATVDSLLELSVWASDSLLANPVALDIDDYGRAYVTRTNRRRTSEFDIRRHPEWETRSIAFKTLEDRRNFLHEQFPIGNEQKLKKPVDFNQDGVQDWRDLTVETEEIYWIEDQTGDGLADYTQRFADGFNTEVTDVAGGVMAHDNDVFVAVAPDLWRLQDRNGDGVADYRTSISHGWQVHIGFGGHNMSGVIMGPDGRIYWGIGDIGMHVVDQEGAEWAYPNQGVIARCNPDGSDFEVFAAGLRNTHEFVFDIYGNLISVDNDGDHPGESERLVYITNGSDSGWRINWQFGKYKDPDNNKYKVWMEEGLHLPRFPEQAAFITPCIRNYTNGPTGMVYNPGGALSSHFDHHFFLVEFNGNPARSGIHTFTLRQKGATFEFEQGRKILGGILPTGLDMGPDGALYCTDWIDGWDGTGTGRIWKLDTKSKDLKDIRKETKQLLARDFGEVGLENLSQWLGHEDMRVRQKSQFELVKRGSEGVEVFRSALQDRTNQLRQIHAIWGISQLARKDDLYAQDLIALLSSEDVELRAQAAKMLGDIRYKGAADSLIPLLQDPGARVRFFAAEALGRCRISNAQDGLIQMLLENDDEDAYLRHAGSLALARIGQSQYLTELADHPSEAVRLAAVIALRRMRDSGIVAFLEDESELLLAEAARAINDDWSIAEALPALGDLLLRAGLTSEPLLRRAINANLRVGSRQSLENIVEFAKGGTHSVEMRVEAIAVIGIWPNPSVLDRVDGRYRGDMSRDPGLVLDLGGRALVDLLGSPVSEIRTAALHAIKKLRHSSGVQRIKELVGNDPDPAVRAEALKALATVANSSVDEAIEIAFDDRDPEVRRAAIEALSKMEIDQHRKVAFLQQITSKEPIEVQQSAILALAELDLEFTRETILTYLQDLVKGKVSPEIQLELIVLAEKYQVSEFEELIDQFREKHSDKGMVSLFWECLEGGSVQTGRDVLVQNNAAQCLKCHAIKGYGGVAGPSLDDLGSRSDKVQILRSLVDPSAELAPGFGVVTVELEDGNLISGILQDESEKHILITNSEGKDVSVAKSSIKERIDAASSMPAMGELLTKSEIRDLLAFLITLRGEDPLQ